MRHGLICIALLLAAQLSLSSQAGAAGLTGSLDAVAPLEAVASVDAVAPVKVAVASNFAVTAQALVALYLNESDDDIVLLIGSTGKHTSQIRHGLAVDVFLAADSDRPALLEKSGLVIEGSRFTYALGRLALWSLDPSMVDASGEVLKSSNFNYLAIANPKIAPYGVAAKEVLAAMAISPNLVYGESVGQAFQFASSGNAELALVAFAQVKGLSTGSQWLVPNKLHQTIKQQAVLLNDTESARRFIKFLKSEAALTLIETHGYLRP